MVAIYAATANGSDGYTLSSFNAAGFSVVSVTGGPTATYNIVSVNDLVSFRFAGFDNANGALYTGVSGTATPGFIPTRTTEGTVNGKSYFISNTSGLLGTTQTVVSDPNGTALPSLGLTSLNVQLPVVPCYACGSRILTTYGEVAVQDLRPGDVLVTRTGEAPVVWTGHRVLDFARHPHDSKPISIQAGAFGRGLPMRELRLSPDHAVFDDGLLIPIRHLVNGATITQEAACERVTYWHVELARHDVILAEGLPAESYLDTGNRGGFGRPGVVRPHAAADADARRCAPTVTDLAQLHGIRARLREVAARLGHALSDDPAPRLFAGGVELVPETEGRIRRFRLPPGVNGLRLVSRSAIPAEMLDSVPDPRRLGLGVCSIRLDGAAIALDGPCLTDGWHAPERHGEDFRWTNGDAGLALPAGSTLDIELGGTMRYWAAAEATALQSRAA